MAATAGWVVLGLLGVGAIVWGAEAFARHLGDAAVALGVSSFALALLLAGAEPEELATGVASSLRHAPAIAFGDVVGANVTMCFVALGVGALVAPLPFGPRVRLYGLLGLPVGCRLRRRGVGRDGKPGGGRPAESCSTWAMSAPFGASRGHRRCWARPARSRRRETEQEA